MVEQVERDVFWCLHKAEYINLKFIKYIYSPIKVEAEQQLLFLN